MQMVNRLDGGCVPALHTPGDTAQDPGRDARS